MTFLPDLPDAVCAQVTPELWFPAAHDHATSRLASSICRTCPAADACLAYALAHPELDGIWAGTTARQRIELRRGAA